MANFSSGVRGLDELLEGGVETQAITEFIGEFGAGKTQLCHQLAVMVQLPVEQGGLEAKALYIDAEGTFRPERIIQIAKYRKQNPEKTLENIIYARAYTKEKLLYIIDSLEKIDEVGLIILDNVSYHFVFYKDIDEYNRNVATICFILKKLQDLSFKKDVSIVVTDLYINKRVLCDPMCLYFITNRILIEKCGLTCRLMRTYLKSMKSIKVYLTEGGFIEKLK